MGCFWGGGDMKDLGLLTDISLKKKEYFNAFSNTLSKIWRTENEKLRLQLAIDDAPSHLITERYEKECVRLSRYEKRLIQMKNKYYELCEIELGMLQVKECDMCGGLTYNTPVGDMELTVCSECVKCIERVVL